MQAVGRAYETRVLRYLDFAWAGSDEAFRRKPWLGYEEPVGRLRAAQPDLVVLLPDKAVIFEIKLSRCIEGFEQIERTYVRLVQQVWRLPCAGVVVFRNPCAGYKAFPSRPNSLREALKTPAGYIAEWHLLC